jgi:hypothetical protein
MEMSFQLDISASVHSETDSSGTGYGPSTVWTSHEEFLPLAISKFLSFNQIHSCRVSETGE